MDVRLGGFGISLVVDTSGTEMLVGLAGALRTSQELNGRKKNTDDEQRGRVFGKAKEKRENTKHTTVSLPVGRSRASLSKVQHSPPAATMRARAVATKKKARKTVNKTIVLVCAKQ